MDLEYYVNRVKFELTGNILESELNDEDYAQIVNNSLQIVNRYYSSTQLVQTKLGNNRCLDLNKIEEDNNIKINSVTSIHRTQPNGSTSTSSGTDPMLISQWNLANNYYNYGSTRFLFNYLAYNTTNQIMNTLSTDLDYREDQYGRKLYVNFANVNAEELVIEYVPRLDSVDQVKGTYWIDILYKLSLANAKIQLGRIRTRYTLDNALWKQDGENLLNEGKEELKALEERLQTQANYIYPLD